MRSGWNLTSAASVLPFRKVVVTSAAFSSSTLLSLVGSSSRKLSSDAKANVIEIDGHQFERDEATNVSPAILAKTSQSLLHIPHHPLKIIKDKITAHLNSNLALDEPTFTLHDDIYPVVTMKQNFDSLLIPTDHPSRSSSDNYFINRQHMLRAHTSAHQCDIVSGGERSFLVAGDVYRRDEIDRSHYPVFHQMEGVRLFSITEVNKATGASTFMDGKRNENQQESHTLTSAQFVGNHLKNTLEGLVDDLFGPVEKRWVECYFPFTHPSWELEIFFDNEWLEVLGCGVMEQELLDNSGADSSVGWAFGLGLERLAMVLFDIPDIRLFWSKDDRFLSQFHEDKPIGEMKFKPFSKYPPCTKDISFFHSPTFAENELMDVVRSIAGDLVEHVECIDTFVHPKTQKASRTYRIVYRSMERTVTNEEINDLQNQIRDDAEEHLGVELR
eukprot:m.138480 g.138480  ORF g.138480 m.138480 type:complete len:443 (+) comp15061_c0_seq1:128-1456(+)